MFVKMKRLGCIVAFAALVTGASAVSTTRPAQAASTVQCKVNVVEYSKDTLLVQCVGGQNFFAQVAPAGGTTCSGLASNLDTIKVWLSMTQTALLAGKTVLLYFNTCSSVPLISAIDLNR
jgi:hypothetical protein